LRDDVVVTPTCLLGPLILRHIHFRASQLHPLNDGNEKMLRRVLKTADLEWLEMAME